MHTLLYPALPLENNYVGPVAESLEAGPPHISIYFIQGRAQTWVRVPFAPPNIALHLIFKALHLEKMLLLHSTKSPLSLDSYKVLLILLVYDHL